VGIIEPEGILNASTTLDLTIKTIKRAKPREATFSKSQRPLETGFAEGDLMEGLEP
jgi:hypothetical protein